MIVNKNKTLILLVGCFAISSLALSGCRSGGFKKPDLAVLKFWKAPESSVASKDTPPPPAKYFDPAPIREEQIAKNELKETIDLDAQRFRDTLNQATNSNASTIANNIDSNARSLNNVVQNQNIGKSFANAKAAMYNHAKEAVVKPTQNKVADFKLPADLKTANVTPQANQSLASLKQSIYLSLIHI